MESQFLGNEPRLILFARSPLQADNFLKSHDIGAQLPQHLDDSLRADKSVHAAALVNVISNDSEGTDGIFHLQLQPASAN